MVSRNYNLNHPDLILCILIEVENAFIYFLPNLLHSLILGIKAHKILNLKKGKVVILRNFYLSWSTRKIRESPHSVNPEP